MGRGGGGWEAMFPTTNPIKIKVTDLLTTDESNDVLYFVRQARKKQK